jgi:hypothetical protein
LYKIAFHLRSFLFRGDKKFKGAKTFRELGEGESTCFSMMYSNDLDPSFSSSVIVAAVKKF